MIDDIIKVCIQKNPARCISVRNVEDWPYRRLKSSLRSFNRRGPKAQIPRVSMRLPGAMSPLGARRGETTAEASIPRSTATSNHWWSAGSPTWLLCRDPGSTTVACPAHPIAAKGPGHARDHGASLPLTQERHGGGGGGEATMVQQGRTTRDISHPGAAGGLCVVLIKC